MTTSKDPPADSAVAPPGPDRHLGIIRNAMDRIVATSEPGSIAYVEAKHALSALAELEKSVARMPAEPPDPG